MYYLMSVADRFPLYREVIAPQVTPLGAVSAVVDGAADVAPVDSYAYCLLQKYRRDLTSQLRTIARTPRTPIPPLVASTPGLAKLAGGVSGSGSDSRHRAADGGVVAGTIRAAGPRYL